MHFAAVYSVRERVLLFFHFALQFSFFVKITLLVVLGFARAINVWRVVKIVLWSAAALIIRAVPS